MRASCAATAQLCGRPLNANDGAKAKAATPTAVAPPAASTAGSGTGAAASTSLAVTRTPSQVQLPKLASVAASTSAPSHRDGAASRPASRTRPAAAHLFKPAEQRTTGARRGDSERSAEDGDDDNESGASGAAEGSENGGGEGESEAGSGDGSNGEDAGEEGDGDGGGARRRSSDGDEEGSEDRADGEEAGDDGGVGEAGEGRNSGASEGGEDKRASEADLQRPVIATAVATGAVDEAGSAPTVAQVAAAPAVAHSTHAMTLAVPLSAPPLPRLGGALPAASGGTTLVLTDQSASSSRSDTVHGSGGDYRSRGTSSPPTLASSPQWLQTPTPLPQSSCPTALPSWERSPRPGDVTGGDEAPSTATTARFAGAHRAAPPHRSSSHNAAPSPRSPGRNSADSLDGAGDAGGATNGSASEHSPRAGRENPPPGVNSLTKARRNGHAYWSRGSSSGEQQRRVNETGPPVVGGGGGEVGGPQREADLRASLDEVRL